MEKENKHKGIKVALRLCPPPNPQMNRSDDEEAIVWEKRANGTLALQNRNQIHEGGIAEPNRRNFHSYSPNQQENKGANKETGSLHGVSFSFDHCFSMGDSNKRVYQEAVEEMAVLVTQGVNSSVVMYGQTGSGKTFTMHGGGENAEIPENNFGILQLGVADVFSIIHNQPKAIPTEPQTAPEDPKTTRKVPKKAEEEVKEDQFRSVAYGVHDKNQFPTHLKSQVDSKECISRPLKASELSTSSKTFDFHQGSLENDSKAPFNSKKPKESEPNSKRSSSENQRSFHVSCSYVEVYNDNVFDLLVGSHDKIGECLAVTENPITKTFYVKRAIQETVASIEEVCAVLKKGEVNRHYAETTMNHSSSRSHSIFILNVRSFDSQTPEKSSEAFPVLLNSPEFFQAARVSGSAVREATLTFVDLAGSEKVSNHTDFSSLSFEDFAQISQNSSVSPDRSMRISADQVQKMRLVRERIKEGQSINRSLFFLTQVVALKAEKTPEAMIPYRNSPLTKILKSSISGENSMTLLMLCLLPTQKHLENSLSTIKFGSQAKKIETKPLSESQEESNKAQIPRKIREKLKQYEEIFSSLEKENKLLKEKMSQFEINKGKMPSSLSHSFANMSTSGSGHLEFEKRNNTWELKERKEFMNEMKKGKGKLEELASVFVFDCLNKKVRRAQKEKRDLERENKQLQATIKSMGGEIRHLHGEILTGGISKTSKESGDAKIALLSLNLIQDFKEGGPIDRKLEEFEEYLVGLIEAKQEIKEDLRSKTPSRCEFQKRTGSKEQKHLVISPRDQNQENPLKLQLKLEIVEKKLEEKFQSHKALSKRSSETADPKRTKSKEKLVKELKTDGVEQPIKEEKLQSSKEANERGENQNKTPTSASPNFHFAKKRESISTNHWTPLKSQDLTPKKSWRTERKPSKSPMSSKKYEGTIQEPSNNKKGVLNSQSKKQDYKTLPVPSHESQTTQTDQGALKNQKQINEKTKKASTPKFSPLKPGTSTQERTKNEKNQLNTNKENMERVLFDGVRTPLKESAARDFERNDRNLGKSPILKDNTVNVVNRPRQRLQEITGHLKEVPRVLGSPDRNSNLSFSELEITCSENDQNENRMKFEFSTSTIHSLLHKLDTRNIPDEKHEEPLFSFRFDNLQ